MATIVLQGATYSNVGAVDLPKTPSGTARFYEAPAVKGKFTAQSSTGVQTINLPYYGDGYPVLVGIYVAGGYYNSADNSQNPTWYNLVKRYAIAEFYAGHNNSELAPNYSTSGVGRNQSPIVTRYKSSTSNATSYSVGNSSTSVFFTSDNPTSTASYSTVKFSDAKTMKVYVNSSGYGFYTGIVYDYFVVYSS